jgi:predicted permease
MPSDLRPDQRETYRKRAFRVETAANGPSLIRSKYRQALFVLMAITAVVLLIACANLANLFLARGAARQREIAIRMALGSGRGRLMRQLLAESMLLSLGGALLGIVFAHWGAQFLVSFLSSSVYQENKVFLDLSIDPRVLAFTIGVAILTSLLFGLVPASRAARVNPQSAMKANSRGLSKDGKLGLGKTLVIAQISLSLVLVAGAGLLLATLRQLEALDPGFDRNNVLLIGVTLPSNTGTPDRNRAIFDEMLSRLRALVGVRSASYSDITPVGDAIDADILQFENNAGRSNPPALVFFNLVSDGYFETLGTPLLSGRDFNARDTPRSPKVAIVNETLSKKFFQGQNPIGKYYRELRGAKLGDPIAIIGVARDAKYANLREPVPPTVYIAARKEARTRSEATFELQAAGGSPASLISAAKSCMEHVDGDASLQFKTLAAQVGRSLSRERLLAALSGFFGGLALLLATIGLYGVTSYNIARRRGEIGIRMALGATESRVLHIVLGEVAILVAVGLVIGFALSLGATRLIASFLYGVKADDPVTLSLAAAVLSLVATIAGFLPARRASRLDPMASLREE